MTKVPQNGFGGVREFSPHPMPVQPEDLKIPTTQGVGYGTNLTVKNRNRPPPQCYMGTNMKEMGEEDMSGLWITSVSLLVFSLTMTTIGWGLLLMGKFLGWVCMKSNAVLQNHMRKSHHSIWLKFKCNSPYVNYPDATFNHGRQKSKESGSSPSTKNTGTG